MKTPIFKKIAWAVDTMEPVEFQKNAQVVIQSLTRGTSAEVYPIHIFNCLLPGSELKSTYEEAYFALSEKRMKELRETSNIPQMKEGKILLSRGATVRMTVQKLLEEAEERNADSIVVATHSHGAVERFLVGSFAETLLLKSEIPVITVNPNTKVREKISKVLFPTTFDERFQPAFEKTVELCSTLGASLTVFYKEQFIPMLHSSYELLQLLEEESLQRKRTAERYREWAKSKNVAIDIKMDSIPGNVAEEIVFFANEHRIDLIAMASQTSQFGAPRVGSICRRVVRKAECPVWTFKTDD